MINNIYIGNWRVDLYKDESVSVTSSVIDVEDITKNKTDFSKSFTVPASDRNNILFKHWYDADIDNAFDARIKVDGRIELDGIPFKIGKFKLQKVNVKYGRPSSYVINFVGALVAIGSIIGKDYLTDLDLSAYDHAHSYANSLLGLQTSLSGGAIIYNLLAKKQYYYNSSADTTMTDALANIAYNSAAGANGVLWNEIRPSLQIIKIIDAIEAKYTIANGYEQDIVFSRDLFGRAEFTGIYMWLNNDKTNNIGGGSTLINFDGGVFDSPYITQDHSGYIDIEDLELTVTPSAGYESIPYTIKVLNDGVVFQEISAVGTKIVYTYLYSIPTKIWTITYEISANEGFNFSTSLWQQRTLDGVPEVPSTATSSVQNVASTFTIAQNLPKIKIMDFLKGIFDAFKCIIKPRDNDYYVDTLNNYYKIGTIIDVTKYVDFSSYNVERGNILNNINYKFQSPTTILNIQFEGNTGVAYGNEDLILKDSFGKLLDGDSLDITLPFEQIMYDRLIDTNTNVSTNFMYGAIIDDKLDAVNPKAHLFYNSTNTISNLSFVNGSGVKNLINSGNINTPSHTFGTDFSLIFSQEFNEWDGTLITNTLYLNYHQEFIEDVFNIKRRTFKFKANLPLRILTTLELNDTLKIKNNYYRINKYTTDLTTGKTDLDLINIFREIITV
ncbi:MAG: hypothetical protein HQ471_07765 [Flavobacteriales bacterium]|nr:hypothetical protein [Flavobacteriales bacterium]